MNQQTRKIIGVQARFLLCESCFWCASDVAGGGLIEKCPACKRELYSAPLHEVAFAVHDAKVMRN